MKEVRKGRGNIETEEGATQVKSGGWQYANPICLLSSPLKTQGIHGALYFFGN